MYKWHILCGRNSLCCCLNHYATASCTSSQMNLQPLSVTFQKCENCMVASPGCDALCLSTSHQSMAFNWSWNCVAHVGMGSRMMMSVSLPKQFILFLVSAFEDFGSNGLYWWCQQDCESRSRGPHCQIGQHHFTGGCLWLEFLWLERNGSSLHCFSANFPMGTIVWHITSHTAHSTA